MCRLSLSPTISLSLSHTFIHSHTHTLFLLEYLHFLYDEVEIVPAGVSEEPRVEGERYDGGVRLRALPREVLRPASTQLHEPGDDDEDQSQHLCVGKVVLHLEIRNKSLEKFS